MYRAIRRYQATMTSIPADVEILPRPRWPLVDKVAPRLLVVLQPEPGRAKAFHYFTTRAKELKIPKYCRPCFNDK